MSIPVPSVTSSLHTTYTKHDVIYLPTEPGVYQLDVTWGGTPLPGSPFFTMVSETEKRGKKRGKRGTGIEVTVSEYGTEETGGGDEKEGEKGGDKEGVGDGKEAMISFYRPSVQHNLVMYYSATSRDPMASTNKTYLERMLRESNPLDGPLLCVTIDLEVSLFIICC